MTLQIPEDPFSQFKIILIALFVVLVLSIIGYLAYTKSLLETKVAQDQTTITMLRTANDEWAVAVKTSNKAVNDLKAAAIARTAAAKAAQGKATASAVALAARATALQAARPTGDACAQATALINSYYNGGK